MRLGDAFEQRVLRNKSSGTRVPDPADKRVAIVGRPVSARGDERRSEDDPQGFGC
ncbi:MAG TPA: hypothetical protein VEU32_15050 [Burkholderiales bacterium]|nr:hypothetical protein [Burkholderiales bacterium]